MRLSHECKVSDESAARVALKLGFEGAGREPTHGGS
jgi:hypothetical protein